MRDLLGAVSFLTRVPVATHADETRIARSVPWFPLVGALVGLAIAGVYTGLVFLLPPVLAAAIAVACGLLLTGAFHEDGLADVADAFGGGKSREDALRILKDPRLGTYGVLALTISVLVRVAAIATFDRWTALAAIPAAHAVSRAASIGAMTVFAPIPEGLGATYVRALTGRRALIGILSGVVVAELTIGWWTPAAVALAVVPLAVVGWLAQRKIGGINGDVLGAIQQGAELLVLTMCAAAIARGAIIPWWRG